MNELSVFQNNQFGSVRVVTRNDEPWFVAKDVAACIEYKDPTTMVRLCREKDVCVSSAQDFNSADLAESGNSRITLISESGLYRILAKCNLPKCEPFESWVFDEVLPSIRKTGGYGIRTVDDMINDPDTAIRLLTKVKVLRMQNEQLALERDTAIKTKAWIGSKREATAMNTASQKSKENEKLKEQIGDAKNWKSVTAIPWLEEYFALSKGLYGAVANKLKGICEELGLRRKDIPDSRYGTIKVYPVEAINMLMMRVMSDQNMLRKYRKA